MDKGDKMNIYLWGCLIAFIIAIFSQICIWQITMWDIPIIISSTFLSWVHVLCFVGFIAGVINREYDFDHHCAWVVKRRTREEQIIYNKKMRNL